jgi:hypothetical protein
MGNRLLAWATFAVTVGLLIVAAIQASTYRNQAKTMRDQASIMHRTLTLTERPRIRVRHVMLDWLYNSRSSPFEAGKFIYGRFEVVNVGGSVARVATWRCHLRLGREGSPPEWPQSVDPDPESDQFESVRPVLEPGVYAELRFKMRHPLPATFAPDLINLSRGTRLYAIGRITYADQNGVTRETGFCRHWATPSGTQIPRFHRFDDPDFEYED